MNCSETVYQDPNEWRISRREIEQQIREMRMQLETLRVSAGDNCSISPDKHRGFLFQEIRRHLMIKRPHFIPDPEEAMEDAKDARSHHNVSKPHSNRHHKKHDHAAQPATTTARATLKPSQVTEVRTTAATEITEKTRASVTLAERTDGETITTTESTTTTQPTTTTTTTTVRPKKLPRRPKIKETLGNRTEVEEDKPLRRRKIHHHRRNNTLFTNSVHDEVSTVNASETTETTVPTQSTMTTQKLYQTRYTTLPTTTMKETTLQRETTNALGTTNDFNKETTIEMDPQTGLTGSEPIEPQRTSTVIAKSTTDDRSKTASLPSTTITTLMTNPVTVAPARKTPRVHKNRTNANLGPSRIDVTILESPDRKNRQGW